MYSIYLMKFFPKCTCFHNMKNLQMKNIPLNVLSLNVLSTVRLSLYIGNYPNSHTYPAILNTIDFSAKKWNAQIHSIPLKLPITSEEQIVNVSDTWMLRRSPHHSKNQGSLNFFGGAESYDKFQDFFLCQNSVFSYRMLLHNVIKNHTSALY